MECVEERLKALSIARRVQPDDDEPTYLLDISLQPSGSAPDALLAVACSNYSVRLHNRDTLSLLGELQGHGGALCGVTFAHASPDLLFSGSADGTVRTWDVRRSGTQAVQVFKSDPLHRYCSFDVNCTDGVLCAGTEQVADTEDGGGDSFLVFWDVRGGTGDGVGGGLLGVYSEMHSDDVTQVRFHPRDKDCLASGSTDGLVNVFDLSRGAEEDALLVTFNSGSSAASVCWSGGPSYDQLLCLSHDEGLHLWDLGQLGTEEPFTVFSAADARSLTPLPAGGSVDYLVGGRWLEEAHALLVVAGTNSGELHLLECSGEGLRLLGSLQGGHTATVRCFLWDPAGDALFTGGEDAQLLLWKPGGEELTSGKRESSKSASALKLRSRPHKKHGYQRDDKSNVDD